MNQSVVDRKYVIVSGYYADEKKTAPFSISKEQFLDIWYENTLRYSTPQKIYLVNVSKRRPVKSYPEIDWINISENLGHVHDFISTNDTKTLTGYTLSVLMGMLLAYNNKADFIYKEQDCLAFGSWVDELYQESRSKNKEMLLGRGHIRGYIEQSLFLCRHDFLLEFINRYLSFNAGDYPLLPELKVAKIMELMPDRIGFFDFGYGRIRPVHFDDRVFFIQQPTDNELSTLRAKDLLTPEKLKINFGCGSNVLSGWNNHDMDVDITKPLHYLDNQADNIFAEHVVEHLTIHDAYRFFEECHRILKPGGWLRVTLPSVSNILVKESKEYIKFLQRNNWGDGEENSAVKSIIFNHGHKSAWTRELLKAFLSNIGFETRDAELYTSCVPEFVGIEGHQRVIGSEFNEIESIVVEARKIVGNQVPGLDLKEADVCNTHQQGLAAFIENRETQEESAVQDIGVGSSRSSAQASTIKRVLLVRTDSIGDNVLAASMLPYIREKYKDAQITVLCQEHIAELYEACPFVDNVVVFNRKRACEDAEYRNEIINRIRALKPDVSLNSVFSSEPITHIFATECGAGERIAIEGNLCNISAELRQKYNQSYTKLLPSAGEHKPELARHRDFLKGLGVDVPPLEPVVWTSQEDENFAKEFFEKNNLKLENTVALFPAAQHSEKVYPFCHQILRSFNGFKFVILGGSDAGLLAKEICENLPGKCHDLTGKTSIRQMASILRRCRLYLGADSAGAHIACAVGIPNVVVLGGGHFGRFVPYSPLTSVVCLPLECYGCNWRCRYQGVHCIEDVKPRVVAEAVRQTLGKLTDRPRVFVQDTSLWKAEIGEPKWKMFDKFVDTNSVEIIHIGKATPAQTRRSPDAGPAKQKGNGMTIVTSIAPKEIAKQVRAVRSWHKLGFDVVSINSREETEILGEDFPDVNFVEAKRDARSVLGKPFVYLDDILEYISHANSEICGIVNSDIFLSGGDNIVSFIRSEAKNSLVYGSRIEVDSLEDLSGEVYERGFDFFFFDKSIVSHFPKSDFCIGATWWDYWVPLVSVLAGYPVKKLVSPFAYHIKHPWKWDEKQWFLLGGKFYGYLRETICEKKASGSLSGRWDLLARMLSTYAYFFIKKMENVRSKDEYTRILYDSSGPCILEFLEIESQQIGQAARQKVKSANPADYTNMDITVDISYEDYHKAVELNRYGEYLLNKGDAEGAMNAFTEAVRILPNLTFAYNNVGLLYLRKDQPTDALRYFLKTLKIDPIFIPGIINSVGVLIRSGKIETARSLVRNSAQKFIGRGKPAEAAEVYKGYLLENPGDEEVINALKNLDSVKGIESSVETPAQEVIKDFFTGKLSACGGSPDGKKWSIKEEGSPVHIGPAGRVAAAESGVEVSLSDRSGNGCLVSAIVSTYNAEKYISACLDDLENQTIADRLEIIVVNSGSQQNEEKIVKEYQKKFSNIKYIKTEQREGVYAAWNRAVKVAQGEFLTNANTDDRHSKDALEIMAKTFLANPDVALVYGDQIVTKIPNDNFYGHKGTDFARQPEFSRDRLLFGCCVGSQPMWRKGLHDEFGYFDETLDCAGDWDFWLRIAEKYQFRHIPEFLGLYYRNEDGIEHGRKIHSLYERYLVGKRYGNPYISVIGLYQHKDNPLVSVIMPAYNAANYIGAAIESVLIANYRNFELIVVDDGSADDTKETVAGFKDDKIRYFHKENGGPASARNVGIKNAAGSFVVFLDADDMIAPNFISSHLAEFEKNSDAELVYCDDCLMDEEERPLRVIKRHEYAERKFLIRDLFRCGFPVVPFRGCIRKSVFEKIGLYEEGLLVAEDFDMVRRAVKSGLKMEHLSAPLYLRRMTAGSLSRTSTIDKAKSYFKVLKRFTDTFGYDELFPDVKWDGIEPARRRLHGRTLVALTYLTIGQTYADNNYPAFALTARQMACYELKQCLAEDARSERLHQMLQRCELVLRKSAALRTQPAYQTT